MRPRAGKPGYFTPTVDAPTSYQPPLRSLPPRPAGYVEESNKEIEKLQRKIQEMSHSRTLLPKADTELSRYLQDSAEAVPPRAALPHAEIPHAEIPHVKVSQRQAVERKESQPFAEFIPVKQSGPPPSPEEDSMTLVFHTQDFSTTRLQYSFATITDSGDKWGQISSLYNTSEKIDFRNPPEEHYPIYTSIYTYLKLKVELDWFPIPCGPMTPLVAPVAFGSKTFTIICYLDYTQGYDERIYRCRIIDGEEATESTTYAAIQEGPLHFSVELFENKDDILGIGMTPNVYYLDFRVGYRPGEQDSSLNAYNIYWRSVITADASCI
jgi:hypothetical protein